MTLENGLRSPHETRNVAGVVSMARKTAAEPGGEWPAGVQWGLMLLKQSGSVVM